MKAWIKILALAVMSLLIVYLPVPWIYAVAVAVVPFIAILRANPVRLLRMLLPALPFILIISALQALLQGSLALAAVSALRMLLLYVMGSAVTITTGETEFSRTIERALGPVDRLAGTRIGKDIATMTVLALAFLPTVHEEYVSIKMAQQARGARYGVIRGAIAVVVPLMSSLSRRADNIALAMEARCYGLDK
jgi:energy-coupling factor transporter transmembrane protein EcfT